MKLSDFTELFKDRLKNPFMRSILATLIIYHWSAIVYLTKSKTVDDARTIWAEDFLHPWDVALWGLIGVGIFLAIANPWFTIIYQWLLLRADNILRKIENQKEAIHEKEELEKAQRKHDEAKSEWQKEKSSLLDKQTELLEEKQNALNEKDTLLRDKEQLHSELSTQSKTLANERKNLSIKDEEISRYVRDLDAKESEMKAEILKREEDTEAKLADNEDRFNRARKLLEENFKSQIDSLKDTIVEHENRLNEKERLIMTYEEQIKEIKEFQMSDILDADKILQKPESRTKPLQIPTPKPKPMIQVKPTKSTLPDLIGGQTPPPTKNDLLGN